MGFKLTKATLISSVLLIVGCASHPDKIKASHVSPEKYQEYDCKQIESELTEIDQRTTALYQTLKQKRNNDSTQTAFGMIFFWPALLFLEGGDGVEAMEYAQLQGDYEALRQNATKKDCAYKGKSPEQIMKEHAEAETEDAQERRAEPRLP